jgi:hypothetical protein
MKSWNLMLALKTLLVLLGCYYYRLSWIDGIEENLLCAGEGGVSFFT